MITQKARLSAASAIDNFLTKMAVIAKLATALQEKFFETDLQGLSRELMRFATTLRPGTIGHQEFEQMLTEVQEMLKERQPSVAE